MLKPILKSVTFIYCVFGYNRIPMNSNKSFQGASSSRLRSNRFHYHHEPRFAVSYQNEMSKSKPWIRYPLSNGHRMVPYPYTSFGHNYSPHRQKLFYSRNVKNQQFIPFEQKNIVDDIQKPIECNHIQIKTIRSDEKLNMTIDTVKRKLEEHKLNEVSSKYNNAYLSETEEENCKLAKTARKKRIEHSKMSPKIDIPKKNERKDNIDKNKQVALSDNNVYHKKSQILRKSILQQLFRLNSNNLRQVLYLPESSKKYNFAIMSLLRDRRNALSKELRGVAEKSLEFHNVPADSAQGEKIFQDAFLGHLGTMLDTNASVELLNMEPQVIKELSKVLQDDLMDSTNEDLSVQNLATFIDQDLTEVLSNYDYFNAIQCKIEPLYSNVLETSSKCNDGVMNNDCLQNRLFSNQENILKANNKDCEEIKIVSNTNSMQENQGNINSDEKINKVNILTSISAVPELFSKIKARVSDENDINNHIPFNIKTEISDHDENVSDPNEIVHIENLFDRNDKLKTKTSIDYIPKLSVPNIINQIKKEEVQISCNKSNTFITPIDCVVNEDVNKESSDFVAQDKTVERIKLEKEILSDLKFSDIQKMTSGQFMSNISLDLNPSDQGQCGNQNNLIYENCTSKKFVESKNVLEENKLSYIIDNIISGINSNKIQNCAQENHISDQCNQCCNLKLLNSLGQLPTYSVNTECFRPNTTCSSSQTFSFETVEVGCQTEINFDSYIDFLCSNKEIFNDMNNFNANKSSEILDKMKLIDRYIQILLRNKLSLCKIFESMNSKNNDISSCETKSYNIEFSQNNLLPENNRNISVLSDDDHVHNCEITDKLKRKRKKLYKKKNLYDEKKANDIEKKITFNDESPENKIWNQPKDTNDFFTIKDVYSIGKNGELHLHKNLVDIDIDIDKSVEISTQTVLPKLNETKNITIKNKTKNTNTNPILNTKNNAKKVKYKKKKPYKYKNITKPQKEKSNGMPSSQLFFPRNKLNSNITAINNHTITNNDIIIDKHKSKIDSESKNSYAQKCSVVLERICNKTCSEKNFTDYSSTIPHSISSNNINISENAKSTSTNHFFAHVRNECTSVSKSSLKNKDLKEQPTNVSLENAKYLDTSHYSNITEKNVNAFVNNTENSIYDKDLKLQKKYPNLGENMFKFCHKDSIISMKCAEKNILAVSKDGYVYYFCGCSGRLLQIFKAAVRTITCFHVDIKNKVIYCGSLDSNLTCFDYERGISLTNPISVGNLIRSLCYAWNIIFIGTQTGFVIQYNIETNSIMSDKTSKFSENAILALEAIKEGPRKVLLIASHSQDITVKDADSGLLLRTFQSPDSMINDLYFTSGNVFCITNSTDIQVFDFVTGNIIGLHICGKNTKCLQIYKGLLFAASYNGSICIFKPGMPKPFANVTGPGKMLLAMIVTNDMIITSFQNNMLLTQKIPENVLNETIHN